MTGCFMGLAIYSLKFIGTPYVWAGNEVTTGVDCSGFVCEMLRSCGMLGKEDLGSQDLYNRFKKFSYMSQSNIKKDSLLFFGASTYEIDHVAIAINNWQMVEAGGEGRENTDKGYVRVRPINWRSDLIAVLHVDPNDITEGRNK